MSDKPDEPAKKDDPIAPGGRLDPQRLTAEHGNAESALRALAYKLNDVERENADYRRRIKDLKGKVPEGSVVLTGDDLKAFEAYKALGTAEDVETRLKAATEVQDKLKGYEKQEQFTQAAQAAKMNSTALAKLYGDHTLVVEGSGENAKVFVSVKDGETESKVALDEHVKEHYPEFEASLYEQDAPAPSNGSRFIVQSPARRAASDGKLTQEQIKSRKAARGDYKI